MFLLQKLQQFRELIPDKEALVSISRSVCYGELAQLVESAADWLYQNGIKPGDSVGLFIADEIEHLLASLSLLALGTRQVALASHESLEAHQQLITRTNLNWIVTDEKCYLINRNTELNYITWSNFANASLKKINRIKTPSTEGILYINTSGTTSRSNIILFTETQIGLQANRHDDYSNERLLRLATVEFNTSKRHRLYSLWNGGCNVFRPAGNLQEVISFAHSQRVTCLDVSRMHISELCSIPNLQLLKGVKVRPGGGEVPSSLRQIFTTLVPASLYVRYAITETGAISMAGPADHNDDASCGKPLAGVNVEIVNESGEVLPPHSIGKIRVKTHGMATGYWDNQDQTAKRFRDQWFYPGDAGYIKSDGQLVVSGREDDMIILNGINIFPSEIEHVLELHPAVAYAIALSVPSNIHGQIPVAAVQLKLGATITMDDLMNYSQEKLGLKCPRRILILEAIPRNNQGKLLRREVCSLFGHNKN